MQIAIRYGDRDDFIAFLSALINVK